MATKKGVNALWFLQEYQVELNNAIGQVISMTTDKNIKERYKELYKDFCDLKILKK